MPKSKADALTQIAAALQTGVIYNVEYEEIKRSLNRALYAEEDAIKRILLDSAAVKAMPDFIRHEMLEDLYWSASLTHLPALAKKVAKECKKFPDLNLLGYATLIHDWTPIAADMEALKTLVKKGRMPALEPSNTTPRTMENTGTCAICRANVKLNGQVLYHHGFTLPRHDMEQGRQGRCPGTGYKPWEVSPEGAVAYVDDLRKRLAVCEYLLSTADDREFVMTLPGPSSTEPWTKQVNRGDEGFDHELARFKGSLKLDIGALRHEIEAYEEWIAGWIPTALQR